MFTQNSVYIYFKAQPGDPSMMHIKTQIHEKDLVVYIYNVLSLPKSKQVVSNLSLTGEWEGFVDFILSNCCLCCCLWYQFYVVVLFSLLIIFGVVAAFSWFCCLWFWCFSSLLLYSLFFHVYHFHLSVFSPVLFTKLERNVWTI